jgi:hypothetical protein
VTDTRSSGQASADYVAVLLVVGVLLAGAATTALAVPGVGERVVRTVRTGLCIVGGDVCRTADATAAGLEPCITGERSSRQGTALEIAVVRLGEHGEWQLALRSDGSALVTRREGAEGGGTVGVGLTFSPIGLNASARVAVTAGYRSGRAWRFPDAGSAAAFLEAAERDDSARDARTPDVRWDALAGGTSADAGVAVAGLASAGLEAGAEGVIGLRREGARRTLTVELGADAPALGVDLPVFAASNDPRSAVIGEVTWEDGAALELALRTARERDGRLEELTARLDLRDPVNRRLAARLLAPGDTRAALRDVARRMARAGVVERHGYTTTEHRRGIDLAGRLGVAVGLSHQRVTAERRLVDAVAWVRGGPPVRRFDCLGM